ncbi:peroxidase 56-like, partial [Silene latifolia]|uniref:peroxidase 56-like n=1 Tax=Silene latifolia TaxID=37657 RepID=UPI003D7716B4
FGKQLWKVPTGRRDGIVSLASEALIGLPSPFSNFSALKDNFAMSDLSVHDLVTLSGAHTIGVAHCGAIRKRLFNFTGAGGQDPSIDSEYAESLKMKCKDPKDTTTTVDMDPDSFLTFDNHYYSSLKGQKGLFQSDAALLTDKKASKHVEELLKSPKNFFDQFAVSVQKMGAIKVLTGDQGQIRKKCNVVN